MATAPEEMEDLGKVIGGLLVNFGTITSKAGMLLAGESPGIQEVLMRPLIRRCLGRAANANKKPGLIELLHPVKYIDRWCPQSYSILSELELRILGVRLQMVRTTLSPGSEDVLKTGLRLELLNTWQVSIIKGNAGEIGAILGSAEVSSSSIVGCI